MNTMTVTTTSMSSREIAELTGKRHPDVRRDIRNMLEILGIGVSSFAHTYRDAQNKEQEEYRLDRELTLTLVSGYDIPLRHRVVTRLAELEAKPVFDPMQALSDPETMRGLLLTYTEKVLALKSEVEYLSPKADALDRISDADGLMNITLAAKALQMQPKRLFDFMRTNRWIYRRVGGSGNVAYQDKIQAGYLTHKVTTVRMDDGFDKAVEQVLVKPKGLARLGCLLAKAGLLPAKPSMQEQECAA